MILCQCKWCRNKAECFYEGGGEGDGCSFLANLGQIIVQQHNEAYAVSEMIIFTRRIMVRKVAKAQETEEALKNHSWCFGLQQSSGKLRSSLSLHVDWSRWTPSMLIEANGLQPRKPCAAVTRWQNISPLDQDVWWELSLLNELVSTAPVSKQHSQIWNSLHWGKSSQGRWARVFSWILKTFLVDVLKTGQILPVIAAPWASRASWSCQHQRSTTVQMMQQKLTDWQFLHCPPVNPNLVHVFPTLKKVLEGRNLQTGVTNERVSTLLTAGSNCSDKDLV